MKAAKTVRNFIAAMASAAAIAGAAGCSTRHAPAPGDGAEADRTELCSDDINLMVSEPFMKLCRFAMQRAPGANTRRVLAITDIANESQPQEAGEDEVCKLIGGILREELAQTGLFLIYDQETSRLTGNRSIFPEWILRGKYRRNRMQSENGAAAMEFSLQLELFEPATGRSIWQTRESFAKRID